MKQLITTLSLILTFASITGVSHAGPEESDFCRLTNQRITEIEGVLKNTDVGSPIFSEDRDLYEKLLEREIPTFRSFNSDLRDDLRGKQIRLQLRYNTSCGSKEEPSLLKQGNSDSSLNE